MENKIVLLGAGGHCKSVLDAILRANEYQEIVITDPDISPGAMIMGCKVVGTDCEVGDYCHISVGAILCGRCRIGRGSLLGAGSTIIQDRCIGNKCGYRSKQYCTVRCGG